MGSANPISGSYPPAGSLRGLINGTFWGALKVGVTNDGHKIYYSASECAFGPSGLAMTYNSPEARQGMCILAPGDAVNLKKGDGNYTGDFNIPATWKRLEIKYTIDAGSASAYYGVNVLLLMSDVDDNSSYLYQGYGFWAPFPSALQESFFIRFGTGNPFHEQHPNPDLAPAWSVFRTQQLTFDKVRQLAYYPMFDFGNVGRFVGSWSPATGAYTPSHSGTFILDRRDSAFLDAPDGNFPAILIAPTGGLPTVTIHSARFFY